MEHNRQSRFPLANLFVYGPWLISLFFIVFLFVATLQIGAEHSQRRDLMKFEAVHSFAGLHQVDAEVDAKSVQHNIEMIQTISEPLYRALSCLDLLTISISGNELNQVRNLAAASMKALPDGAVSKPLIATMKIVLSPRISATTSRPLQESDNRYYRVNLLICDLLLDSAEKAISDGDKNKCVLYLDRARRFLAHRFCPEKTRLRLGRLLGETLTKGWITPTLSEANLILRVDATLKKDLIEIKDLCAAGSSDLAWKALHRLLDRKVVRENSAMELAVLHSVAKGFSPSSSAYHQCWRRYAALIQTDGPWTKDEKSVGLLVAAQSIGDLKEGSKLIREAFGVTKISELAKICGSNNAFRSATILGTSGYDPLAIELLEAHLKHVFSESDIEKEEVSVAACSHALGGILFRNGKVEESNRWVLKCLNALSVSSEQRCNLISILVSNRQYDLVKPYLISAVEKKNIHKNCLVISYYYLGAVYQADNEFEKAEQTARKGLALVAAGVQSPDNVIGSLHADLAFLLKRRGSYPEAIAEYKLAMKYYAHMLSYLTNEESRIQLQQNYNFCRGELQPLEAKGNQ